ncbi:T9SS type A sorting domain-containing protein [bacterium]|nr:T9SS type A sorting domain-containing protein [bacterium]
MRRLFHGLLVTAFLIMGWTLPADAQRRDSSNVDLIARSLHAGQEFRAFDVQGSRAYAISQETVWIFDTNPDFFVDPIDTLHIGGNLASIVYNDGGTEFSNDQFMVYVGSADGRLFSIDTGDDVTDELSLLNEQMIGGHSQELSLGTDYLIVGQNSSIRMFDWTTDPEAPAELGDFSTFALIDMYYDGTNNIYYTGYPGPLHFRSISDPENPGEEYTLEGYGATRMHYDTNWAVADSNMFRIFESINEFATPIDSGETEGVINDVSVWAPNDPTIYMTLHDDGFAYWQDHSGLWEDFRLSGYYNLSIPMHQVERIDDYNPLVMVAAYEEMMIFEHTEGLVDVEEEGENPATPSDYALSSVYPNPFNPTLHAVVELPNSADLEVALYNIEGRRVADLVDTRLQAGSHRFTFNGDGLASGIYLLRAVVPGQLNQARRVVYMK